jgi:predicted DNA-binding transcriptional regulator AlpA
MVSDGNSRPNTLECGPITASETDHRSTSSGRLDDEVIGLKESARIASISLSTLRRQIEAGEGPAVVRLSPRRVGIRWCVLRAWLKQCEEQSSG